MGETEGIGGGTGGAMGGGMGEAMGEGMGEGMGEADEADEADDVDDDSMGRKKEIGRKKEGRMEQMMKAPPPKPIPKNPEKRIFCAIFIWDY